MKDSAIKVVIDVGSSRTRVTIGEVGNREDSVLEVLGSGVSSGGALKAGIVTNIPTVSHAIRHAVAIAEEEAGLKINSALISISGEHILGMNSDGRAQIRNRRISKKRPRPCRDARPTTGAQRRAGHPARAGTTIHRR